MLKAFGKDRLWEPVLGGRGQVRSFGAVMAIIGLGWAAGGVVGFVDVL